MPATVLDSYALIAYFRGEPAGVAVKELLQTASQTGRTAHMTEVNYAEVKYTLIRKDGIQAWTQAREVLAALPIEFHPVTRELSDLAADFKARHTLSLADAFAAALAKLRKAELVTGDPELKAVGSEVKIRWLG